jgi:transcriptional regulator with XRE-family HTH domain
MSKKMSQEALAIEADVPISQIGRIERGEVNPTLSTLGSLAQAFGLNLSDMLKF